MHTLTVHMANRSTVFLLKKKQPKTKKNDFSLA